METKRTMIGIPYPKKRVDVQVGDHIVMTDHGEAGGGENLAPSMGATFLAGLVACTTSTARGYCKLHDLPLPIKVIAEMTEDDETELITNVSFEIIVPPDFPQNRLKALVKAAETCTVKTWWMHPPQFETKAVTDTD
ncbi:MAG TPA: OsmC family protein [Desulfatirhabdiaceae bacterium]|nr:OsmC family protein [Desulfatirhabdiaceae bacterium]